MPPTTAPAATTQTEREALLAELRVTGANRDRVEAELERARGSANDAIRAALAAGIPYSAIAEASGVTKGRIGQIASAGAVA